MKNCRLINTTLALEYSIVDVQADSAIDSVMNPISGIIRAESIEKLIMDKTKIDPNKTQIMTEKVKKAI